jgi:hypothetical protein
MQIPNTFISCQTPKEKNIHIVSLRNESESVSNQNDKQRLTFERIILEHAPKENIYQFRITPMATPTPPPSW